MRNVIVVLSVCIILLVSTGFFFHEYSDVWTQNSSSTSPLVDDSLSISHEGWETVSSEFGFSLKYPHKEVGAIWNRDHEFFVVSFFFSSEMLPLDEGTRIKLDVDMQSLNMYNGLDIFVISPKTEITDFPDWIRNFLQKETDRYGNREKVLSEEVLETTVSGEPGYIIIRQVERSKTRYVRKEIFVRREARVYRLSYLAPSEDTTFPQSGLSGKQFLERVEMLSAEMLRTFVFDGSSKTKITFPKTISLQLTGEAKERRERLLSALRVEPFFDEQAVYPESGFGTKCSLKAAVSQERGDSSKKSLRPSPGLSISAEDGVLNEEGVVELHAYDESGNHTGPMPLLPGFENALIEEHARSVDWESYGAKKYIIVSENINGRIEMLGKKFSIAQLHIRGDGNSCEIASMFIPVTPYSIATIPMTERGDLGPVSYDVDGDGIEDLKWSLVHPLLPSKLEELMVVFEDMKRL